MTPLERTLKELRKSLKVCEEDCRTAEHDRDNALDTIEVLMEKNKKKETADQWCYKWSMRIIISMMTMLVIVALFRVLIA